MKIKKNLVIAVVVALVVLSLALPVYAAGATYAGTEACKTCHADKYNLLKGSIHQKMIQDASVPGNLHGNLSDPRAPPSTGGLPDPKVINYVIGGWYKEESYIQYNSATGKYNVTNYEWSPINQHYANDKSIRDWLVTCAGCHTTGFDTSTKKFKEMNIGCEACHGPGSAHVTSNSKADIVIDKSPEACGKCHIRATAADGSGFNFPVGYVPGKPDTLKYVPEPYNVTASFFPDRTTSRHREQFLDYKESKHYTAGITCVSCHDSHKVGTVTVYDSLPAGVYGIKIYNNVAKTVKYVAWDGSGLVKPKDELCKSCHGAVAVTHKHEFNVAAKGAALLCTDCHMPDVINVDSKTLRGALSTHNFKALSPDNSLKYGADKMPNSCTYRCHQDKGADKTARAQWAEDALKGTKATAVTTATAAEQPAATKTPGFEGTIAILGILSVLFAKAVMRKQ